MMFLANSLKEKLKKNYLENDTESIGQAKFHYTAHPKDPRVLLTFRATENDNSNLIQPNFYSTQKLQALDKKEWENTFTIPKLRNEWKTRVGLDFEDKYKKFSDELISTTVSEKKSFVKNLVDPDILELKKKYWNISNNTDPKEEGKPELPKQLFEIESGLKDFKVVPLLEHFVEEGVDSRNHLEVDGKVWNTSNQVIKPELTAQDKERLAKAKENTTRYWKENDERRKNEQPFPISEDKKKIEVIRYFQKYRTPYQKTVDYNKTMNKIKDDTFIERENAENIVKYRNPGMEKFPEKINALVFKEMYNTYKEKYNEMTGRISKAEMKKKQKEKNRFRWTDIDLANKITAVNTYTDSNFPKFAEFTKTFNKTSSYSQEKNESAKNSYLLPLVIKGTDIHDEEDKIQEKIEEEYKKKRKKELLLNYKGYRKNIKKNDFQSKYPLDKEAYELTKKIEPESTKNSKSNIKEKLEEISKSSNCGPHFLEAYDKVAGRELRRLKSVEKKNSIELTFEYSHPGTYREFTFYEKEPQPENAGMSTGETEEKMKKKTISFWSCCMNTDKDSRGCQRTADRNFKWIYSPI